MIANSGQDCKSGAGKLGVCMCEESGGRSVRRKMWCGWTLMRSVGVYRSACVRRDARDHKITWDVRRWIRSPGWGRVRVWYDGAAWETLKKSRRDIIVWRQLVREERRMKEVAGEAWSSEWRRRLWRRERWEELEEFWDEGSNLVDVPLFAIFFPIARREKLWRVCPGGLFLTSFPSPLTVSSMTCAGNFF